MRRRLTVPPEFVQWVWMKVDGHDHGTRNATLAGAVVGLAFAMVLRVWMRLITEDEPGFTVGGTGFIFIVVTGFGAAAGYAFAVRHRPRRRLRRRLDRFMGYVPMLGMGPFMIFFLGGAVLAWLPSHPDSRRSLRWGLATLGLVVTAFWILVFFGGGANRDTGLVRPVIYLVVAYVLFVSLRFAVTPVRPGAEKDLANEDSLAWPLV